MKSSEYIADFFAQKGIDHAFGYQGTMICHFADSIGTNSKIENHCSYNEQGAAFAAVGYAKSTGRTALAYATSGPGACNLLSGVADAYYDSAPVIFITGQLNTYEYVNIPGIRQNGFQEMDVVSTMKPVTKYCTMVKNIEDLRYILEKAWYMANEGRKGPVVIDLPMDMQRQEIDPSNMRGFNPAEEGYGEEGGIEYDDADKIAEDIISAINSADGPAFLLGNGIVRESETHRQIVAIAEKLNIPILTSMLGRELLPYEHPLNMGYIGGAYGHRYANIISYKKADLIVTLGCSMCKRQVSMFNERFAKDARIIRVDIDPVELKRKVHSDETGYYADCQNVIDKISKMDLSKTKIHSSWLKKCQIIKQKTEAFDKTLEERIPNNLIEAISQAAPDNMAVCVDVGQHQVWASQSFNLKPNQSMCFSGGHGAMGFALPAAIGAHYATKMPTMAICGDGAMQMNIQELQWVFREQIPMLIVVMNNSVLGLIRQQQDDMLSGRTTGATLNGGYSAPDFVKIAEAYGIKGIRATDENQIKAATRSFDGKAPLLIEAIISEESMASPKTYFGEEMYNQKPYIPEELLEELLNL